jgi:hypothetical protein
LPDFPTHIAISWWLLTVHAGAKETLDKVLIADFFLVLAALGWLAAGVAQSALGGSSPLLDVW